MKDYASMSDFEINKAVFVKTQYYDDVIDKPVRDGTAVHWGDGCNWREFDPCNNPADAWQIISENKISTMWMTPEKEWCAWAEGDLEEGVWGWENVPDFYHCGESQLRAAMIVFLMMKESE